MSEMRAHAIRCAGVVREFDLDRARAALRRMLGFSAPGRTFRALDGIDLDVPRGSIVGVLGRNGAGKSTLLRVAAGVYPPSSGRVLVEGSAAGLFELGGLGNPSLSGRQYARRYLSFMGVPRHEVPDMIRDIEDFSELGRFMDAPIRTLSSGMSSRLYFATLTSMRHEIYLVDELLSVGDEHFQGRCRERIRARLLGGASGLLVTHDWSAILRLCEHAHVLEQGRIVFSGPAADAVVRHLSIKPPVPTKARIDEPASAEPRVARCGENLELSFQVTNLEDASSFLSVTIEILEPGIGWEILVMSDPVPVGDRAGRYEVRMTLPSCPLRMGTYSLNVFLTAGGGAGGLASDPQDVRSWTVGNGLSLVVHGEAGIAQVDLPCMVRVEAA